MSTWEQTIGRTIDQVRVIPSKPQCVVLLFSDGSFAVVSLPSSEPQELTAGLLAARELLEPRHPEAFAEYDRLNQVDHQAARTARLENILGAIHNNLEHIPELKERITELVNEWNSKR